MKIAAIAVALCAVSALAQAADDVKPHYTVPYNVVWSSPSRGAADSMPLGNGQVGINLWVEEDGDLRFYISRNDSFTEVSRLVKIGGVRISLDPNPFKKGMKFRQELNLADGSCEITAGEGKNEVSIKIYVTAYQPEVLVRGRSQLPIKVRATAEIWRTKPRTLSGEELNSSWTLHGSPAPVVESADIIAPRQPDRVVWYHRNENSLAFASTIKTQSLDSVAGKAHNPLLHRTFGGYMRGRGFRLANDRSLVTETRGFDLQIAAPCEITKDAAAWLGQCSVYPDDDGKSLPIALRYHTEAWHDFWDRSHVIVNGDQSDAIPGNEHPLRIGYDSNGGNKFPGQIVSEAVYISALPAETIVSQIKYDPTTKNLPPPDLVESGPGKPREIAKERVKLKSGFTLEAVIQPKTLTPGRIFDRLTAGGGDGFLFDTHPGDTLRLIVGPTTLSAKSRLLEASKTYHVAATYDAASGAMRIYLDGQLVAQRDSAKPLSITQAYILQRYMQTIGGQGPFPIKFNGGQFTVEPKALGKTYNADWRAWGDCFWWQNTRHMYHPMLASGDFDMMDPLFDMYEAARPLAEARTRLYHGAEGCYFPETMTVWGTYSNGDYGWNRAGHQPKDVLCPWWQYAWNQGPELVGLLLDRWDYTQDETFLAERVLPMAESVLKYFDTRFKKDGDGRIVLDPTQSIETYWQDVVNDMPTTAGLNDITARLCDLPQRLVKTKQRQFFERMRKSCPTVPVETAKVGGRTVRRLAPAQKYNATPSNCENPELYGIWPFRLYGLGRPGLEEARTAYATRHNHLDVGWGYDGNCAALLGLTDEAARILKVKCANSNPAYRWPATWGPNFDWLPDQNHGGNLLETTQLMLLQPVGDKLLLLPAWPKTWDIDFKLHAPKQTVVECVYRGGRIERLVVTPESRRADVVLP
jgi:hypothetical protein